MARRLPSRPSARRQLLAWALCSAAAGASATCGRPLQVAVSDLGVGSYQEQGQLRGLIPELAQELAARSGCRLELVFLPRARALQDFDVGRVDVITSMLRTPERDARGHYLPYGYTQHDLLLAPEAAAGIASLADLIRKPELRLGVVRGIRTNSRVDQHLEQLLATRRAEYSPDSANLAAKLAARRIHAAIMPNALHIKLRRDGALAADIATVSIPEARPQVLGLYVHRSAVPAAVTGRLREQLARMVQSGWVRQAYVRHFGEAETRRMELAALER